MRKSENAKETLSLLFGCTPEIINSFFNSVVVENVRMKPCKMSIKFPSKFAVHNKALTLKKNCSGFF